MTAKQWLSRARYIDREIEQLIKAKDNARDDLTKITQNYDSDGAQTSKDPHSKFDRLAEYESMIDEKIDELIDTKEEITRAILDLDDRRQKRVLIAYYINMQTIEQIAVDMSYSFRQVTRIRRAGIHEIQIRNIEKIERCP